MSSDRARKLPSCVRAGLGFPLPTSCTSRNSSRQVAAKRRREAISAKGDSLETIKKIVPWEDFRADIEGVTETKPEERKSNAGRKPYAASLKFKIVVLQSLHNLSDEQTEYLIRDRISFMRFLDLELEDPAQPRSGCFARGWRRRG